MKFANCLTVLPLLLLPIVCYSQSPEVPSNNHPNDLFSALLEVKEQSTGMELLKRYPRSAKPYLWSRLLSEAMSSSSAGSYSRALFLLELAKGAAEQLEDKARVGHTYYRIGYVRFAQGEVKLAAEAYLLSKKTFEEADSPIDLIYVLSELGALFAWTGDYERAEKYSKDSLALADSKPVKPTVSGMPDKYGIAYAWFNLGEVNTWKGDYISSVAALQKSLALWEALNRGGDLYTAHVINALTRLGIAYRKVGDYAHALKYWHRAQELAKTTQDKPRLAGVLVSIGVLYIDQRDYSKASGFLREGLRLFTELSDRREVASALINIGVMSQRLTLYGEAVKSFNRALANAKETGALDLVVAAQEGLGAVCYQRADYAPALVWFDEAWSVAQRIGDKIRMAELLWRKGQVYYSQQDYVKAIANTTAAADLAAQLRSPLLTYLALTLLGKVHNMRGEHGGAVACFRQAIDAVEKMRDLVAGGEKEQQMFFEDKLSPYQEMTSVLARQGDKEGALMSAERAKGRVLLDVLRGGRTNISSSLNQSERSEERRLYAEMVALNAQIRGERMREKADEERTIELEARLEKARNEYEAFQTALYSTHPELKTKRGVLPSLTSEDINAAIPDARTAVLEYVVTDAQTLLFVLTRDSTRRGRVELMVRSINVTRDSLTKAAEEFRNLLAANQPGFRQLGRQIYDQLIKPAEPFLKGKKTLCIIPDGPLWNLSFQALQTQRDEYVIELYAVYYAPSLQVLREMRKRSQSPRTLPVSRNAKSVTQPRITLYAVGNPKLGGDAVTPVVSSRNAPLAPLPETEKEVQTLATGVYGPRASLVHVGADAREEEVKVEIGKYRVLHFATHGVLDSSNPLYSCIVLAASSGSKEDGLLEAWELMEMNLTAELVVLSACETGRGRVGDGEGLIGMTWALFVAGVPAMVASQWQVPSESTTKLMVSFHKSRLRDRFGKKFSNAEAWRRAALTMIRDPRYRRKPYYWAGFVVMGDGEG